MKVDLEKYSTEDLLDHLDALTKLISKRHSEKSSMDIATLIVRSELEDILGPSTGENFNEDL